MRKHVRPPGSALLLHQGAARRGEPTEATGAESGYLVLAMESRQPLVVRLLDGSEIRGVVEGYDRDSLLLRVADAQLMLRKAKVKYYWLEKTAPSR